MADKAGPLNIEIPCTLIASILAFAWIFIHKAAGLIVFSLIYGFFAGAITTITAVIDAALCPTLDVMGVRMGMLLLPWAGGLLIGTPIAAAILPSSGWFGLQVFAGAVLLAATLFAVAVRAAKYGWAWNRRC